MTKTHLKQLEKKVHDHTMMVMIECADHGYGCDYNGAIRSANRLIEFVVGVVNRERGYVRDEVFIGHKETP